MYGKGGMDVDAEKNERLYYGAKEYRVIDAAPSGRYALAQDAAYLGHGRYGAFSGVPIVLFRVADGQPEPVAETDFPFDDLDGPWLDDVLWLEEKGVVKLCFMAMELSEMRSRRLSLSGKNRIEERP